MMKLFQFFLLMLLSVSAVVGQESSSGTIGSRDGVEIRVFREDDLTTRGQLSESGEIDMPLIGSVRLAGMTTTEAARFIETRLLDGYLVKPEVSVSITSRVRKTVTVLGQAQRPGVFQIDPNRELTIVEAIGLAGGMTRIANDKKVTLKRKGSAKPYRVNVKAIAAGEARDIPLRDGDVISIPESLF